MPSLSCCAVQQPDQTQPRLPDHMQRMGTSHACWCAPLIACRSTCTMRCSISTRQLMLRARACSWAPPFATQPPFLLALRLHSSARCQAGPVVDCLPAQPSAGTEPEDGIRFVYEPPSKLSFRTWQQRPRSIRVQPQVDVMLEGQPLEGIMSSDDLKALCARVRCDAGFIVHSALLQRVKRQPEYKLPRMAAVSVVLCDDARMSVLNSQHRGKEGPTDVLSFDMTDDLDFSVKLPLKLLGDMFISLDTAQRQAQERGHSLRDELRILMVHGVLHLCGMDHEKGGQELLDMAAAEQAVMRKLRWKGEGLIGTVGSEDSSMHDSIKSDGTSQGDGSVVQSQTTTSRGSAGQLGYMGVFGQLPTPKLITTDSIPALSTTVPVSDPDPSSSSSSSSSSRRGAAAHEAPSRVPSPRSEPRLKIKLVALDMDGTMLDSNSVVRPAVVDAIQRACRLKGVRVIIATGKARPAAIRACEIAGLAGPELLVSAKSPGLFLQGLAVHGQSGQELQDVKLNNEVVEAAFVYVQNHKKLSLVAFLGDECVTLRMTDELQYLHDKFYEPLARVALSLEALLRGKPVRKLLFMDTTANIEHQLKPYWEEDQAAFLTANQAKTIWAVSQGGYGMLELVPNTVDKWAGAQLLLKSMKIEPANFMAVGDGWNDYEMVRNAGLGVAMGNAVPELKKVAKYVVAHHDEDGVAEALERFVL